MNYWFTADPHFGHTNIIKYCNRPFNNVNEMNNTIINNWNAVVESQDIVYVLGDFFFCKNRMEEAAFEAYFGRLNGSIVFIEGNHDKYTRKFKHRFLAYHKYHETHINGQAITLCHYAGRVWNKSHYGAWHLYGHSHGSLPDDPNALSMDVGVDTNDFKPYSFDQIKAIMAKKDFKPIDHHRKRK